MKYISYAFKILKSFRLLGVLALVSSLFFYLQKDFTPIEFFVQVAVHMIGVFILHLLVFVLLDLVVQRSALKIAKVCAQFIYAMVAYGIIFLSISSAVTFYFWLAPVNSILLRNFFYHIKHYSEISLPINPYLTIIGAIFFSALIFLLFFFQAKTLFDLRNHNQWRLRGVRWPLVLGIFTLVFLAPILANSKETVLEVARDFKNKFVEDDPVFYTFYLALRRRQLRQIVSDKESEFNDILENETNSEGNNKNLILITIDALRADYLNNSLLRKTYFPSVDSILSVNSHTKYLNSYANCNYSACGIFSILEGRASDVIEEKGLAIQQYLGIRGYHNYFVVGGSHAGFGYLDIKYGNYLDFYFEGPFSQKYAPDNDELIFEALQVLEHEGMKQPYFIWIHLMGVHFIGERREQYRIFRPDDFDLWTKSDSSNARKYVNHYRNGLVDTDERLKRLFQWFESRDQLKNTLFVLTSDHGENLGEYETLGHNAPLSPEQLHIPFILIDRNESNAISNEWISQINFPAIFCERLDLTIPGPWRVNKQPNEIPIISSIKGEIGVISKLADSTYQLRVKRNDEEYEYDLRSPILE